MSSDFLIIAVVALAITMGALWSRNIGYLRGLSAALLRICWVFPILLSLTPKKISVDLPKAASIKTIQMLVDDSSSMSKFGEKANEAENLIQKHCQTEACKVEKTLLSEITPLTKQNFSPLNQSLLPFILKSPEDPWVFVSDGGDMFPGVPWNSSLKNLGLKAEGTDVAKGLVINVGREKSQNVWISKVEMSPFLFESKPGSIVISVNRKGAIDKDLVIQSQVLLGSEPLTTINGEFFANDKGIDIEIPIPSLPKGQHQLLLRVVPIAGENSIWDNQVYKQIEVLPDTVGVLHLLGAPSWDGRFMRRYLKSEPKYDRISFFILRDPWDSQMVSEREMSLIPFPVERLFTEELPNFRVLVLQNFSLFQFLEPRYQQNLVEFVKNGGGLLFLGGERALLDGDLQNSPLKEILPFTIDPSKLKSKSGLFGGFGFGGGMTGSKPNKNGPFYDDQASFRMELANPEPSKRSFANVYEDWLEIFPTIKEAGQFVGLHAMENVKFKEKAITPLLNAITPQGETKPLAVASYPDKGRAIWVFSDSLWQLAMSPKGDVSRTAYHNFLHSSFRWLLKDDFQKPLLIDNFQLFSLSNSELNFEANLQGPATEFLDLGKNWQIVVCDKKINRRELSIDRGNGTNVVLSGKIRQGSYAGKRCELNITGSHPAFGEVKASLYSVVPEKMKDKEVGTAPQLLEGLAELTKATFVSAERDGFSAQISKWLEGTTKSQDLQVAKKKFEENYYWILHEWYVWLMLMALPLEIYLRRKHFLH